MPKKILLLGSGELGKEFVIAAKRLGQTVIAVDNYSNAPAMQLADGFEVIDMLNGEALDRVVEKHQPDIIVPEIEAIRTQRFFEYEKQGIQVVPSANAANVTMDRRAIRDLAAKTLKLRTANYLYASSLDQMTEAVSKIGIPCVVKPLMSSSGKGQSYIKKQEDIEKAWIDAGTNGRGDSNTVIVEAFVNFTSEITLLTVTQKNGKTLFCPPIGHIQKRGDYQQSWQPAQVIDKHISEAQEMATKVTKELKGEGLWGVEFFICDDGVVFSELSPSPHDTGMVSLAGTQNFNEFELHCLAVLGLPIPVIKQERWGASAVILAESNIKNPEYSGLETAANYIDADIKIFGKEDARPFRRMGIALSYAPINSDIEQIIARATEIASKVKVIE